MSSMDTGDQNNQTDETTLADTGSFFVSVPRSRECDHCFANLHGDCAAPDCTCWCNE